MATFYLDLENGSDAADGTSFANRWKTFNLGATAARIAPGDVIRVMASQTPTLVDSGATWTTNSKTVTLSGAVTATIENCESAWTASANVTATAVATGKQGTNYANLAIAAGFTTGLAAYRATGALDLSAYQQVSFWLQTNASIAASTLSLRLCSDTVGAVSVQTITIPAITGATGAWTAITVDTGGALPASVQSIALYADLDPGTVTLRLDNIIACKASSSADSLTLNSLLGKVHNLYWSASTTYNTNDKRKPTPNNRNGFCYKVTAGGGGNSGGSEPTWPQEIGATVVDGALTWTCEELEDSWHGIQSIVGTTVLLDADTAATSAQGRGYAGASETVATYKFQPITFPLNNASPTTGLAGAVVDSGTADSPITFTGGWDRTDMSTRPGETWVDGRSGYGTLTGITAQSHIVYDGFGAVRVQRGAYVSTGTGISFFNVHFNNCFAEGAVYLSSGSGQTLRGCHFSSNASYGISITNPGTFRFRQISVNSQRNFNGLYYSPTSYSDVRISYADAKNNAVYGVVTANATPLIIGNLVTSNNGTAGLYSVDAPTQLYNSSFAESTEFLAMTVGSGLAIYSHNHDKVTDAHYLFMDGGSIVSATDQRNTASGISWKFRPTNSTRTSLYPLKLSLAKIACKANTAVNVRVYTRRDSTNIKGQLVIRGGQIPGVGLDVVVACEPAINTWVQSSALTFTPTAAGVVEILFLVWDGIGATNNFWIDDLSVS